MLTRPNHRLNRQPKTRSPAAAVRFTACENSRSSTAGRWFRRHMPSTTTTTRKPHTIGLPALSTNAMASSWASEKRKSGSVHIRIIRRKKKTQPHHYPNIRSQTRSRSTTPTSMPRRHRSSFSSFPPSTTRKRNQSQSPASLFSNTPSPYEPTPKTIRHRLHLLRFSLLLRLGHFRAWLSAKSNPLSSKLSCCRLYAPPHNLTQDASPSRPIPRPLFRSRRSNYEAEQLLRRTATSGPSSGGYGGEQKKGNMIRRLSHSTVRSLKKACSLNSERDELREEDQRAMERLDELWRTREFHSV